MKVFDDEFVKMVSEKFSTGRRGFRRGFGSVLGFLTDQFDERVIEKFLERGDIKFLILNSLGKSPMHGYQLISDIGKDFQGLYSPSPGAIYPTLQMLEEAGMVSGREEEGKKVYSLTKLGEKELKNSKSRVDSIFSRVSEHREKHWFGRGMRVLTNQYSGLGRAVFLEARKHYSEDESVKDKLDRIGVVLEKAREDVFRIWSSS